MLRCPKCQNAIKLPGKAGAAAPTAPAGESPAAQEPPQPAAFPPTPKSSPPQAKPAQPPQPAAPAKPAPPAQPARQSQPAQPAQPAQSVQQAPPARVGAQSAAQNDGASGRALIALEDQSLQNALSAALQRIGFGVDLAPDAEQGIRSLERDSYALVATSRNGSSKGSVLYDRVITLAPDVRRNLFLVLVGSDLSTGDGMQAFAAMADLMLSSNDIGASDELLRSTMDERTRLYKNLLAAHVRLDARKY